MDQTMNSALLYAGEIGCAVPPAILIWHHDGFRSTVLRRKRLVSDCGIEFMVDLAETVSLNAGDAFVLDDGRQIIIHAAAEPVLEIRHDNLARIAWHIGNRHTPCEIKHDYLIIRRDHVLEDLLIRLGAALVKTEASFNPEGGAYGIGRTHGHTDGHAH